MDRWSAGGVCIADEVKAVSAQRARISGLRNPGVSRYCDYGQRHWKTGPLAAVVPPQIASVLTKRIHFNTFGGNPVVAPPMRRRSLKSEKEKSRKNS